LDQIVNVLSYLLNILVLSLIYSIDQDMNLAAVFREIGCDLLPDERMGKMGDFQGSGYGIVISDSDEGHAFLSSGFVEIQGFCVALGTADFL
jgi:hypothetical protein